MNTEIFCSDMTRDEVCHAYADVQGNKYGFTDKDFLWVDEYNLAKNMSDQDLYQWCVDRYGP